MTPTDQINMLRDALGKIEHSMLQARNLGNDRLREINLTTNIAQQALAATSAPPAASQDAQPVAWQWEYCMPHGWSTAYGPKVQGDEKFIRNAKPLYTHPAPEAAAPSVSEKPATQSAAGVSVYTTTFSELLAQCNKYPMLSNPVDELVAHIHAWHAAHIAANKPAAASGDAVPHVNTWKHAANEWADTGYAGLQWLRNIEDGTTTDIKAARENMERCCKHAREVADAVYFAPPAPQPDCASHQATLTDAEIDDKVFGYAPSCKICEGRVLARAIIAALKGDVK